MINQTTSNLRLPLPHPSNMLQEDVLRLRTALNNLDGLIWLLNQISVDLPFLTADGSAAPIRMIKNG